MSTSLRVPQGIERERELQQRVGVKFPRDVPTRSDRCISSAAASPGKHWLVYMLYIYYIYYTVVISKG